jgi:NADP-dependent 3-hydroxy acid dehydrogenase YdfG
VDISQEGFMETTPVILITGASSGIGEATARVFAREGWRVVLAARRFERLQALADEIRAMESEALPIAVDIARLEEIQNMVDMTLSRYGQIDVLFNNAGFGRLKWLEDLNPLEDIESQLRVNLLGVIWTTRAVLPHMMERHRGHIINMSSVAGWVALPTYSVYAASKFAVRGFTEALRREVSAYGIRVSGIYPGGVATEFGLHTGAPYRARWRLASALELNSDQVARAVFNLVRRPKRSVIIPWQLGIGVWLNALFPTLADWLIEMVFTRRARLRA